MAEPTNELLRRIQENIADLTNGLQEIRGWAGNREAQRVPSRGSSAIK
jgi:hypothetical protein